MSKLAVLALTLAGCTTSEASEPPAPLPPQVHSASPVSLATPSRASCPDDMASLPAGVLNGHRFPAFCIDRHEVTVADYASCVRLGRCSPECLRERTCSAVPTQTAWSDPAEAQRASKFCNGHRPDRLDHPVNCVSFEESGQYCDSLGKRLPAELEWMWAARGANEGNTYPWGRLAPTRDELCWGHDQPRSHTCPALSVFADRTTLNVAHMAGNVSEWTLLDSSNPRKPGLVFGSSWWSVDDGYVRASLRGVPATAVRSEVVGFRCAKTL